MNCECVAPGHCPQLGCKIGQRGWEICSENCPTERPMPAEGRETYLKNLRNILATIKGAGGQTEGLVLGALPKVATHPSTPARVRKVIVRKNGDSKDVDGKDNKARKLIK